jgi:phosphatidate cytidylyltransferase
MLKQRIITALWGIPLLVAIIWFGEPWFTVILAVWGALAAFEFYRLVSAAKVPPLTYYGLVWTALLVASRNSQLISFLDPYLSTSQLTPLLITLAAVLSLVWLVLRPQKSESFTSWAWTMAGIIYIGWLLSYLVGLRDFENGRNWIFLALFVTFASDTAAFFVGRALGKHKLAPKISPAKTWEGAIAGVFGAMLVSLFFLLPTPLKLPLAAWQAVILGLFISIFGQFGDLAESLFKRNMGAKDSGRLIPGHGGVLDRMDSVVFAGLVVYYYVVWVVR